MADATPGTRPATAAAAVVERLRQYGVDTVFGYPGGPLTPLYDSLYHEPAIRHVLARDEQGAGFMADGYARATGRPGVCLAVCGPGVYNAITPLATAFSDSIPLLLISGQVPSRDLHSGYYHENDQLRVCIPVTKAQFRVDDVAQIVPTLDRAWTLLKSGRQGPVLFEVPGEVLRAEHPLGGLPPLPAQPEPIQPSPLDVDRLAELVGTWRQPVLIAGGGVVAAGAFEELRGIAERLGAPVFHTLMGKSAFPGDHPLAAGLPWKEATSDASDMASRMSPMLREADGMLAVGCRFTQVTTGSWAMPVPESLAQIDIDATEFGRHYPCTLPVLGDARLTLASLLECLPREPRPAWINTHPPRATWKVAGLDLAGALRAVLPRETIVVADVTRLAYTMLVEFLVYQPRTFLHPAAAVSMGYGLPAALGVRAAFPERPIVAVMGDGCFQMTGFELATAVQENLPVCLVVVNDGSLTLIKALQQRKFGGRFLGVDLRNPDFELLARAFGVRHFVAGSEQSLASSVREALALREPVLVEMRI